MPREVPRLIVVTILFTIIECIISPGAAFAQYASTSPTIQLNAQSLIPRATLFVSPASQTLIEGSTFDVSIFLDTKKNSVNTVDVALQFPPDKLAIVNPSGGKSLIQVWLQPPAYSNTKGTARYTGIIPNGVVTGSGLIVTITFKALAPGNANIIISPDSSALANDGLGTVMQTEFGRAAYTITPKPPGDVVVFSPTHPFQSQWYNNNNPVISWQKDADVTDFSYVFDNNPATVPGDIANTSGTTQAYQSLGDGLWYFHIKARKLGIWGSPTHFLVQIDTQPPAIFTPTADIVSSIQQNKALISFFTTDALAGVDHYEVATIDKTDTAVTSPVFVQADSPYQLATPNPGSYRMIVRAVDHAGNTRDESIDVTISVPFIQFLKKYDLMFIIGLLLLVILLFLLHYFFGHKLLRRVHKAILAVEREDAHEKLEEAEELVRQEDLSDSPPDAPSPPTP
jgi:hypothetical protein